MAAHSSIQSKPPIVRNPFHRFSVVHIGVDPAGDADRFAGDADRQRRAKERDDLGDVLGGDQVADEAALAQILRYSSRVLP